MRRRGQRAADGCVAEGEAAWDATRRHAAGEPRRATPAQPPAKDGALAPAAPLQEQQIHLMAVVITTASGIVDLPRGL